MTMLCADIDRKKVSDAEAILSKLGISLNIREMIDNIDFDPDELLNKVDHLIATADTLKQGEAGLSDIKASSGMWDGETAQTLMSESEECQRSFWEQIGDSFLWLAENIIQLLDYLVDTLRIAVAWITFILEFLGLIGTVILFAVTIATAGFGAAVTAVLECGVLGYMGLIAIAGTVLSILLWLIDKLLEWLETVIRDARNKICGKGLPSLPDWDPEIWVPDLPK